MKHPADLTSQELRNIFNAHAKKADITAGRAAWECVARATLRQIGVSEPFVNVASTDIRNGRHPLAATRAAIHAFTIDKE